MKNYSSFFILFCIFQLEEHYLTKIVFNNILKKNLLGGNMKQSESEQRGVRSETFLQIVLLIFIFWYFNQWKMFYQFAFDK